MIAFIDLLKKQDLKPYLALETSIGDSPATDALMLQQQALQQSGILNQAIGKKQARRMWKKNIHGSKKNRNTRKQDHSAETGDKEAAMSNTAHTPRRGRKTHSAHQLEEGEVL